MTKNRLEPGEVFGVAALGLSFVLTIILALAFAQPLTEAGVQAFEDPEDPTNILYYGVALLGFTALLLYASKRGWTTFIQVIVLAAVATTMLYLIPPLLLQIPGVGFPLAFGVGFFVGIVSALALYNHPEWYVLDSVGILVAAGAATIFGISLSVPLTIAMLVGLAIYDAIAVYRTKHMLSLADAVMDLRLPVLLVIPTSRNYRFLQGKDSFKERDENPSTERDAFFMGLGDLVMPTVLVVSAAAFLDAPSSVIGAALGTLAGFLALMRFVLAGKPQAGLPLLNGGAILGFLIGLYVDTGSVVFW